MIKLRKSQARREPPQSSPAATAAESAGRVVDRAPRGVLILLSTASLTVTAIGMNSIRAILAPVLLTLILTICVSPVRRYLDNRGVAQGVATGSIIILMFALLAGFALIVFLAVRQFVTLLPHYADEFDAIGRAVGEWFAALGVSRENAGAVADAIHPANIASVVSGALGGIFSLTGALVIVFTMIILMSSDAAYMPTIFDQLRRRRPHLVAAIEAYTPNVRRYMVVTTVLGIAQGSLNAVALWLVQVPAALLWGVLSFLLSFIPNVGYFFAIIPPLVFGFLVGGWPTVLIIVVVYGAVNGVVQSIIQPRVVGQAVSLSQTVTFFSVLFWAVVIGPIGAILAIPLTLFGKALLVDSHPDSQLWRPAFGPTQETRELKRAQQARPHRGGGP